MLPIVFGFQHYRLIQIPGCTRLINLFSLIKKESLSISAHVVVMKRHMKPKYLSKKVMTLSISAHVVVMKRHMKPKYLINKVQV
jgi:hypothetical protein